MKQLTEMLRINHSLAAATSSRPGTHWKQCGAAAPQPELTCEASRFGTLGRLPAATKACRQALVCCTEHQPAAADGVAAECVAHSTTKQHWQLERGLTQQHWQQQQQLLHSKLACRYSRNSTGYTALSVTPLTHE